MEKSPQAQQPSEQEHATCTATSSSVEDSPPEPLQIPNLHLRTVPYSAQSDLWPAVGNHVMALWKDQHVVVYQAFNEKIASWAVEHQRFGGDAYSFSRMTWIKTNFLWM
jgi:hypothetical protein